MHFSILTIIKTGSSRLVVARDGNHLPLNKLTVQ